MIVLHSLQSRYSDNFSYYIQVVGVTNTNDDAAIIASFPEDGAILLSWFFVITTTPITWSSDRLTFFLFHILFARMFTCSWFPLAIFINWLA